MIDMTKQYTYNGKPVRIYADGSYTQHNYIQIAYFQCDVWKIASVHKSELVEVWEPKGFIMIDMTKQYTYNGKPVRIYADGSDTLHGFIHFAYLSGDTWINSCSKIKELVEVWKPKENEWCFFWNNLSECLFVGKCTSWSNEFYVDSDGDKWKNCAPFTGTLPEAFKGL